MGDENDVVAMGEFTQKFSDNKEDALYPALNSRKSFRTLKEATIEVGMLEQWYVFEQNYAKQQIRQWPESL